MHDIIKGIQSDPDLTDNDKDFLTKLHRGEIAKPEHPVSSPISVCLDCKGALATESAVPHPQGTYFEFICTKCGKGWSQFLPG